MKSEILRLLKENDTYISGQQLCEQFQVSRTAIWKVIDQLKKEGYQIEAVRNKGYRLIESPDVMSKAEIDSLVDTKWAGKNVIYYDETDSTNNRAKEAGNNKEPHGTLFVADMQMAGKGRRGRVWKSPSGSSIYMTILLYPDIPPVKAPQLTLIMAIAVAEGIREVTGLETKIKWPNDIVVNGKKICGILTEMSTEIDYINHVVIGVGINVNQDTFPDDIKETASSLKMELGKRIKRSGLIAAVMKNFEKYYEIFQETEDLSGLKELYNSMLVNKDREVKVLEPGNEYKAYAIGILSAYIRQHTGTTYKELVQTQRLSQAAKLLKSTALSTNDISLAVGYQNTSFFFQLFRKKYGCTPMEYRNMLHASDTPNM